MSVGSFALPIAGSPTPPANVLHEYTTGGTWSKPTDPSFKGVWVFAAGAGGSGGAGHRNSSLASGGSGGGGGAIVRVWIPEASLGATETYAIGAGGTGPASGAGNAGGATLFGLHVEAIGGSGGTGGSTIAPAQVAGGSALLCIPATGSAISGAPGGRGRRESVQPLAGDAVIASVLTLAGGITTSPIASGGAGGGGGGGWIGSLPGGLDGGDGGGAYNNSTLTNGGAGGAAGGSNGTAGVDDIYLTPFLGLPVTTTIGLGTGGGAGGGASGATAGGSGANGGRAAGGGGGGSTESGTRGAGGDGGDGYLIVYEVYEI